MNVWRLFQLQRINIIQICEKLNDPITAPRSYWKIHCVKSVQIRSFFWSVFSHIRTEYGPEKTPYLDTFHAVIINRFISNRNIPAIPPLLVNGKIISKFSQKHLSLKKMLSIHVFHYKIQTVYLHFIWEHLRLFCR